MRERKLWWTLALQRTLFKSLALSHTNDVIDLPVCIEPVVIEGNM